MGKAAMRWAWIQQRWVRRAEPPPTGRPRLARERRPRLRIRPRSVLEHRQAHPTRSLWARSNTYQVAGVASAASLAAQSGPISFVTTDAAGHLASANLAVPDISGLQTNVAALQSSVGTLQMQMKQAFEGAAVAIAMGGAALPSDKKFAISTNYGNFRGQSAMSFGAQLRLATNAVANVAVASGFQQGGIGSRAGVMIAW